MSENSIERDLNGALEAKNDVSKIELDKAQDSEMTEGNSGGGCHKATREGTSNDPEIKKDSLSDSKDKSKRNRSRSRSRHQRESPSRDRRDRRRSRSRDHRTRRSRSRRKSRSRSRDRRRKSRSPDRKRHRSRSVDRKNDKRNGDRNRESKSPSPGKNAKQRPLHDSEINRRRRRSRDRDHRYKRSPEGKHGNEADRNADEFYNRYSGRKSNDLRSPRDNFRKNEGRQPDNSGWARDNQNNWAEKRYQSSMLDDAVGKTISKIRHEFDDNASHFSGDNPPNSTIPVLLSSNCKANDPTFPVGVQASENSMARSMVPSSTDGRLPAPPRMAAPPIGFKDGLPNVREPPPSFLPFRPNNPVTVRLQSEPPPPTFTLLNHSRLPVRNMEPQQVLLQPLQVIRAPTKLEIPVDLRFLNPELRLPLYSTGIINRSAAQTQQVTNFIGGMQVDQTRMMHQLQPRLVGVPQATDIPPPPPPPQNFALSQAQAMATNAPFGTSGVSRIPENVSFIANPPPQLIFGSLGNRPGFITNMPMNDSLQPRIPSSHPPPPPPQIIIPDFSPQISSSSLAATHKMSNSMVASLPAHSTADSIYLKASSAGKMSKSKPKNTGSEKYSPYSCSSEGSSNDAYSDALFEEPFNDTGTPLEEESNSATMEEVKGSETAINSSSPLEGGSALLQGAPLDSSKARPISRVDGKNSKSSIEVQNDSLPPFVGLSGIGKQIDLASTLNLIHVNDLKKVLETANSVTKVKQTETSDVVKSSKVSQSN